MFRCVYCLKREQWGQVAGDFELDHFKPQRLARHLKLDYFNLVYACRRCNLVKLDQSVDDPFKVLSNESISIHPDGHLEGKSIEARRIILQLDLNSPKMTRWRVTWMRVASLAKEKDPALHRQLMSFPEDLPNLRQLRPPRNSNPGGLEVCWHEKRHRGQLPVTY